MLSNFITILLIISIISIQRISADTPANCTYDDIQGSWLFSESDRSSDQKEQCNGSEAVVNKLKIDLLFPDIAIDQFGNKGFWTIIYNQGFEVVINYRKYFAFSYYEQKGSNVTSFCHKTLPGWSHDILGHNWACFEGNKINSQLTQKLSSHNIEIPNGVYSQNEEYIRKINSAQNLWTAKYYPQFEGKSLREIHLMKGGPKSKILNPPPTAIPTLEVRKLAAQLPENFDWRNINGQSFVSPVRNQGSCGSCYSFSATAMIEARLRVLTNNSQQVVLSPQDVVSCSEYSQGCEGGFPYLIGGKYAQDFGLAPEECNPYIGTDSSCKEKRCKRYYTASYNYVGGFYGGCNEELMRIQLVKNGPMSVSFEVYDDFMAYSGGIYRHTGISSNGLEFNPFAITNHAVLAVGFGVDAQSGQKYWIVKNSWGEEWGEQGFFRISRGNNECNIESIAVEAFPIP